MVNWPNFVAQAFNGLVLGALLALISSGLTIIYGTLGVLNLAHGAMFMLGGYAGWIAYSYTHSFIVAVIAGSLFVMVVGVVMERGIIRHFYKRPHEDQLLVTFGLGIVLVELVRFIFGSLSKSVAAPSLFAGITKLGFMFYPTYRLALLGIVAVALVALYIVLYRTRIGMIVRAGVDDRDILAAMGVRVQVVFVLVFALGAGLAGIAGVVGGTFQSISPGEDTRFLLASLVVVIVGGMGSIPGAALGALIIGLAEQLGSVYIPTYAIVITFLIMVLVLALRPQGLLARR